MSALAASWCPTCLPSQPCWKAIHSASREGAPAPRPVPVTNVTAPGLRACDSQHRCPMSAFPIIDDRAALLALERRKSLLLRCWIVTGLFFMVLPGTVLGFTNLLAISVHHGLGSLSAAWIQAHGFSQVFGWIGSFV